MVSWGFSMLSECFKNLANIFLASSLSYGTNSAFAVKWSSAGGAGTSLCKKFFLKGIVTDTFWFFWIDFALIVLIPV